MAERESTVPFDRGHVVWHDDRFGTGGRPWLVLSDDSHPFYGREYLVVGITTTERSGAVAIPDNAWSVGGLPRTSYVSPWFLTTLKHRGIDRGVGSITESVVETVITECISYLL